jgi:AraC-like DNA-binding protein
MPLSAHNTVSNKIQFKCDTMAACKAIFTDQLTQLGVAFAFNTMGEVELLQPVDSATHKQIEEKLREYGIEIIQDPRSMFVQRIKDVIIEMINSDNKLPSAKFSDYLAQRLNHSYGHISKIFSEVTFTSIEHFIIIQKIEKVKHLITNGELTLSEMSWQLNYSSVQHLSNQFKKTTGITPTAFQRIVRERRKKAYDKTT